LQQAKQGVEGGGGKVEGGRWKGKGMAVTGRWDRQEEEEGGGRAKGRHGMVWQGGIKNENTIQRWSRMARKKIYNQKKVSHA